MEIGASCNPKGSRVIRSRVVFLHPTGQVNAAQLMFGRRRLTGSIIGGIEKTQQMLDFCGEKNIVSEVELIRMDAIKEAFERMINSDVKYRFVIDMSSLA